MQTPATSYLHIPKLVHEYLLNLTLLKLSRHIDTVEDVFDTEYDEYHSRFTIPIMEHQCPADENEFEELISFLIDEIDRLIPSLDIKRSDQISSEPGYFLMTLKFTYTINTIKIY